MGIIVIIVVGMVFGRIIMACQVEEELGISNNNRGRSQMLKSSSITTNEYRGHRNRITAHTEWSHRHGREGEVSQVPACRLSLPLPTACLPCLCLPPCLISFW